MQRVRQPNRMTVNADRARALLEAVRRRIERGEGSHPDIKARVFRAFQKYFTELSQPITEFKDLMAVGLRDPEDYSDLVDDMKEDLDTAAADARNLSDAVVSAFNFSSTLVDQLDTKVKKVTSKSQDLQHLSETFAEDTVVAGDDFADDSRIDRSVALEVPLVDIPLNQNEAVLKRQASENILAAFRNRVKIHVLSRFRIYEGFWFALEGEARPEGGRFHFSGRDNSLQTDATQPGVPPDLARRYNQWRADPVLPASIQTPDGAMKRALITAADALRWITEMGWRGSPFSASELDMLANNYHVNPAFGLDRDTLQPGPREAETDRGAPPDEKQVQRANMIDEDPDTFWECEYVTNAPEAVASVDPPAAPSPTVGRRPMFLSFLMRGLEDRREQEEETRETGRQMTLTELIEHISGPAVDKMDLDCSIIIELPEPKIVNWLNLFPHNFSDSSWLEVLDISTSKDGVEFESIEGMKENKFENLLTDEANTELTPEEVAITMAPSRFKYTGQGVWTFPAREVRFIRFDLLQRTPVPAPYDVLKVELSTTVTFTHTSKKSWGLF